MSTIQSGHIQVVLADDHALVRDGIRSLLEEDPTIEVIAEASNGEEALQQVEIHQPDLLIVDIRMPKMNGIQTVSALTQTPSETKALVLSMHDSEEYVLQSVEAGAFGYLLKDISKDEFLKAIHTIHGGGKYFCGEISPILVQKYLENVGGSERAPKVAEPAPEYQASVPTTDFQLTKRQKEILALVVNGMSNKEIAEHLDKSVRTVEAHRFSLMKKMGVKNLLELSNKAREHGLIK
ncbi:response regulator transcription factor [Pontibacter sp. G13]|uniref:response regulator transcription factor n=1 Tax=Pontibacter sp. G13 TaxID=3074898 RepID=UPI00288BC82D|nr:response regulator transcription factor [Pontibacter sp. G13]WNJ17843.1 response regulator transcription factor [Pontibacter sp. G13]